MRKMAEGFKAIRMARLRTDRGYRKEKHDALFTYFDWNSSPRRAATLPAGCGIGGDGAMYDNRFQNLSLMMMSGKHR
jgi:pyruvate-ferredoxin/flavodoxin oxidoreductase